MNEKYRNGLLTEFRLVKTTRVTTGSFSIDGKEGKPGLTVVREVMLFCNSAILRSLSLISFFKAVITSSRKS